MLIRNSICWVDLCHYRATKTFSLKSSSTGRAWDTHQWGSGGGCRARPDQVCHCLSVSSALCFIFCSVTYPCLFQHVKKCFGLPSEENIFPTLLIPWPCPPSLVQPQDPHSCLRTHPQPQEGAGRLRFVQNHPWVRRCHATQSSPYPVL